MGIYAAIRSLATRESSKERKAHNYLVFTLNSGEAFFVADRDTKTYHIGTKVGFSGEWLPYEELDVVMSEGSYFLEVKISDSSRMRLGIQYEEPMYA